MEWQVIVRAPPDPEIVGVERWRSMWKQRLEATVAVVILWNEQQALDAKWKNGSLQDYDAIRYAIYHVEGMLDSYLPSVTRILERAPHVPQKALIGPWAYIWPGYPQPANHRGLPTRAANGAPEPGIDWLPVEVRWWRHWLTASGSWVSEPKWPCPAITSRTWHLNADGLAEHGGAETLLVHRTDLTIGFANRNLSPSGGSADLVARSCRR